MGWRVPYLMDVVAEVKMLWELKTDVTWNVCSIEAAMADRGFKELSCILKDKKCNLIRPLSVSKSISSTKDAEKQSKQIATLRIPIY